MPVQKNRCQKIIQAVFMPVLDFGNGNEASIRCFKTPFFIYGVASNLIF